MKKLKAIWKNQRGGLSRREAILIALICLMLAFFAAIGIRWYVVRMERGDDKLMMNTALSVAKINSSDGQSCPVDNCPGGGCTHRRTDGYVGYFDQASNRIIASKTKGYNEYPTIKAGTRVYQGERGTLIIKVKTSGGRIRLSWVKGNT